MQEKSNLDVFLRGANLLSQHFWQQHQVVIMHPDQIVILYVLGHCFREETIDFLVCSPCRLVERNLTGVVVEEGPEDRIYKNPSAFVENVCVPTYWKNHYNAVLTDHHQ